MKGKICKDGFLELWRRSEFKRQMCPVTNALAADCGDWCPLFGEPTDGLDYCSDTQKYVKTGETLLSICQGQILAFEEFKDEREQRGVVAPV